jgi:hypothetical protein
MGARLSLFLPSTLVFKVASHGNETAESVRGRRATGRSVCRTPEIFALY